MFGLISYLLRSSPISHSVTGLTGYYPNIPLSQEIRILFPFNMWHSLCPSFVLVVRLVFIPPLCHSVSLSLTLSLLAACSLLSLLGQHLSLLFLCSLPVDGFSVSLSEPPDHLGQSAATDKAWLRQHLVEMLRCEFILKTAHYFNFHSKE